MPGMPHQGMPHHQGHPMAGHPMGQMGGQPQGAYAQYGAQYQGAAYGAPPPATNDPMYGYFTAIAGQVGICLRFGPGPKMNQSASWEFCRCWCYFTILRGLKRVVVLFRNQHKYTIT